MVPQKLIRYRDFFVSHATLALVVLLGLGCVQQPYEGRTAVVTGKVSLNDVPVSVGNILFMMEDGHAATAALGTDGTYSSQCRPGQYKVAVTPPELIDPLASAGNAASRVVIPTRYQDLGSSGLSVELKEGDNRFDIRMTK